MLITRQPSSSNWFTLEISSSVETVTWQSLAIVLSLLGTIGSVTDVSISISVFILIMVLISLLQLAEDGISVDLRPLQAAAEVDVNRFPLGERVDRGLSGLAVAVSGAPRATEREVGLRADRAGVDVDNAGCKLAHGRESRVHIARVNRARKAILGRVINRDSLVQVSHFDNTQHRPEDLFLCHPHAGFDLVE